MVSHVFLIVFCVSVDFDGGLMVFVGFDGFCWLLWSFLWVFYCFGWF